MRTRRRGAALLVTVVFLGVLMLLLGAFFANIMTAGRAIRQEELAARAFWLAEAGIEKAALALAGDGGYTGEELALGNGRCVISVAPAGGAFTVTAAAVAGPGAPKRVITATIARGAGTAASVTRWQVR